MCLDKKENRFSSTCRIFPSSTAASSRFFRHVAVSRRPTRPLFLVLFVLLPLQYALVGLIGLHRGEPWPALVMPGFKRVWNGEGAITTQHVSLEAYFCDGSRAGVSVLAFLSALPRSHHRAFLERQCRPASLSGSSATERCLEPAGLHWVQERLRVLYPDRHPTALHVIWSTLAYHPGAPPGEAATTQPLDTLVLPLSSIP